MLAKTITVDTLAPTAVASLTYVDTGINTSDRLTNNNKITVVGLGAGATYEYSINGGTNWLAGTGTSFTVSDATYATNQIQVHEMDLAGNASTARMLAKTITVDTVGLPNAISSITFSDDSGTSSTDFIVNKASQTVTAVIENGAWITSSGTWAAGVDEVLLSLDGGLTWPSSHAAATWSLDGTRGTFKFNNVTLSESNTLQVKTLDRFGNETVIATQAYTLDTNVQSVVLTPNGNGHIVSGLEEGAYWEFIPEDLMDQNSQWTRGTGNTSYDHHGYIHQVDLAGNVSASTYVI